MRSFIFWYLSRLSLFISPVSQRLKNYYCVSESPIIEELLDFFIYLLIPVQGLIVTVETSSDEFFLEKNVFTPKHIFHKRSYFLQGTDRKWAPLSTRDTANQIAGKSWNHRGLYWTLNFMAWTLWNNSSSWGHLGSSAFLGSGWWGHFPQEGDSTWYRFGIMSSPWLGAPNAILG